ncbi:MAG: hypothetical protein IPM54_00095 [Polyangiaceae bacterium]|nr:hypothetical protein [Polyangiaceae bacterium]
MVGRSADVIPQPDAAIGQRTYCPVSGVAFEISESSPRRDVGGRPVYFCCETCAGHFSKHREHIIELRHLSK